MKPRFATFMFWFRIRGVGISICNSMPTATEYWGPRKSIRIFGVKFEWHPSWYL